MAEYVKETGDADFEAAVLKADKPVLVDFWAEWCAPCRMLAPTVDAVARDYEGKADVYKVNVDYNQQVAARYGIRGIPTLIVFKNGAEAERIVGAVGKAAIASALDRNL